MKKGLPSLLFTFLFCSSLSSQFTVAKLVGRDANKYYPGFSFVFADVNIPLNDNFNRVVRLEVLDLSFFLPKNEDITPIKASLAAKLGYRYTFSKTQTGFYVEPKAGYCFFVEDYGNDRVINKSGIAAALEGGYIWEVGKKDNLLNIGFNYKTDWAGRNHNIKAAGITISYTTRGLIRIGTKWL